MRDFGEFTETESQLSVRGRRARRSILLAAVFVLSVGLGLTAFAAVEMAGTSGSAGPGLLDGEEEASAQTADDGPEPVNVLLMGLDGQSPGAEGAAARTDALMLARLHPDSGEASLVSIPRDLYVEGAGPEGGSDRINSAYANGGADKTVEVVENLTGADVDHYVAADFAGFEDVVDSLGGVEVDVEEDYLAHRGIPAGEQTLDGKEALLYARYRKTPEGDLGRVQRQQQILGALQDQAVSWDSIASIPGIVRSLDEHVRTDMGMGEMISLARALAGSEGGMESAQLEGEPVTLEDGRQVLMPDGQRNEEILWDTLYQTS